MNTLSTIEREKLIVDHYMTLVDPNFTTVIPWECVENMQESLDIIRELLAQGNCPAERVPAMNTSLEQGQQALQWLKQHRATDNLIEYARLTTQSTGLPVEIFVDDGDAYLRNKHPLWVYVRDGYGDEHEYVRVRLYPQPAVLDTPQRVPPADLQRVLQFVSRHAGALQRLANGDIDHNEFYHLLESN